MATSIKDKIQAYFNDLPPKKKRTVIVVSFVSAISLVALIGYKMRGDVQLPQRAAVEKTQDISLDPKMLERTQLAESEKGRKDQADKLADLQKELEDLKTRRQTGSQAPTSPLPPVPGTQQGTDMLVKGAGGSAAMPGERSASTGTGNVAPTLREVVDAPQGGKYPPPPFQDRQGGKGTGGFLSGGPGTRGEQGQRAVAETQVIGGIELVSNTASDTSPSATADDKKKAPQRTVYLPPSFMEATLLSGLNAPTMENAKKEPVPALIRINDLAVLPNEVKADLRGCFVIAHGYGRLDDERAHLKLVSLSCLSKKGESVIDQPVSGFVVDQDGKIGLSGTVVAKLGALVGRAALAGFLEGTGEAMKASTMTTQVTGGGTVQTIDTSKLAMAGLGGGFSQAAHELSKFYLELARQTMPVIEVGATKKITLVIQEGLDLVIKDKKGVPSK